MDIGLDNTNANIGEQKTLLSPELLLVIYLIKLPSNTFNNITGSNISDHCVDLNYWFEKSTKRNCTLKEYYDFRDLEYMHVINFISTCWLCLELCVNQELKKYSGLYYYSGTN